MARKSYGGYKGRSGGNKKAVIVVILLIVVAAVSVFLALTQAVTFTPDGPRIDWPFFGKSDPSPTPDKPPVIVIQSPAPSATPTPSPPPPSPEPMRPADLRAVYIDISNTAAVSGALQLAKNGVINAVVIDMKHNDGTLGWTSKVEVAVNSGANPETDSSAAVIKSFADEGVHLIARISVFKENLASNAYRNMSVATQNGVRWLDRDYHGWLDPYDKAAQKYTSDLAAELISLGFDEILLENACFPTIGRPQLIYYAEETETTREAALSEFLVDISAEVKKAGGFLSVRLSVADVAANSAGSGVTIDGFSAAMESGNGAVYAETGVQGIEISASVAIIPAPREYSAGDAPEAYRTAAASASAYSGWVFSSNNGLYPANW